MIGTYSTHIFSTYADTQAEGILSGGKRFVLVMADENNGGATTLYFYDGQDLKILNAGTAAPANQLILLKPGGGSIKITANDNNELISTPIE